MTDRLPVVPVEAITSPDDVFECPAACRLRAGACISRQVAKLGRRPVYTPCGFPPSATETSCPTGRAVRARLPEYSPTKFQVNRSGPEIRSQNATRDRRKRETELIWQEPDLPTRKGRQRNGRMAERLPIGSQRSCGGKIWNGKELEPCTRALRANSDGDLCYECRIQAGTADKHAARKRRGLARRADELGLPDPTTLPASYLDRCVREAFARLERQASR